MEQHSLITLVFILSIPELHLLSFVLFLFQPLDLLYQTYRAKDSI